MCLCGTMAGMKRPHASDDVRERALAAIDEGLDDANYIVPGLGDAGDRQFGPR